MENKMSSHSNLLPPILRLPPELRLKIYRLLLLSDRTVRMVWLKENESTPQPNRLFPAILCTCRLIYNEAAGVLYGENLFRAHRVDDTNDNAASIMRAKLVIGIVNPENGERDASKLEFGFHLLVDSKLRDLLSDMLVRAGYTSRLTIRSPFQSERSSYNAARLEDRVDTMALMQNEFPGLFEKVRDNMKKVQRAC